MKILIIDGKKLLALSKIGTDKRLKQQFDSDYIYRLIKQLKHEDETKREEAKNGLIYLDAAAKAIYNGSFKELEELEITATEETKSAVYSARNSAQADFMSNYDFLRVHSLDEHHNVSEETNYDVWQNPTDLQTYQNWQRDAETEVESDEFDLERAKAELGEAIKSARLVAKLKQSELAILANTSQRYISQLEKGKALVNSSVLLSVFKVLNIDPLIFTKVSK